MNRFSSENRLDAHRARFAHFLDLGFFYWILAAVAAPYVHGSEWGADMNIPLQPRTVRCDAEHSLGATAKHASLKRGCDLLLAASAILFLAPLMVVVGVIIYLLDGGPVLASDEVVGQNGRMFRCWKFRTMAGDADRRLARSLIMSAAVRESYANGTLRQHDPRISRLGDFLRRSSLEELPRLLNVLLGEMSLVGPRPVLEAEASDYGRYLSSYCLVRPGITGLWLLFPEGSNLFRRRVILDVAYIRSMSLKRDAQIIALVIVRTLGIERFPRARHGSGMTHRAPARLSMGT
jgi:exopolysaccharide production protein ExoY